MATLSIRNVSKVFGATQVLHRIDLDLADGEFDRAVTEIKTVCLTGERTPVPA